jgi:hypothetical protein
MSDGDLAGISCQDIEPKSGQGKAVEGDDNVGDKVFASKQGDADKGHEQHDNESPPVQRDGEDGHITRITVFEIPAFSIKHRLAPLRYAIGVMDVIFSVFDAILQYSITPLLQIREIKGFIVKITLPR